MARKEDEIDPDDIDLDKVIWDPRYRRAVIERLNREAPDARPAKRTPNGDDAPRRKRSG
jgi:hypothetical protein